MDTPLFTKPVLGFRAWRTGARGMLHSVMPFHCWHPGVNMASCARFSLRPHPAPDVKCACGFHAFHDLAALRESFTPGAMLTVGAVAVWGDMEVHATGVRAQYAQILVLFSARANPRVREAAEKYGVLAVDSLQELEVEGRRHAEPLPEEMRPSRSVPKPYRAPYRVIDAASARAQFAMATKFLLSHKTAKGLTDG